MPSCLAAFAQWSPRRWVVAAATAVASFFAIGLVTAVIPNPVFGRGVPPTDWALQVTALTAVLSGLLFATYVRDDSYVADEKPSRFGVAGGVVSFLAVGCPTCNKLVLLAVGSSGAIQWFAPVQPYLAVAGVALMFYALRTRVTAEGSCQLPRG